MHIIQDQQIQKPSIFSYLCFRTFLQDFYNYLKELDHKFSENNFVQNAGFGKNSRGYFGLIIKGKRNLTARTILGFANAMNLDSKELLYFENLVFLNQSKNDDDRNFYFERMKIASANIENNATQILEEKFEYVSNWKMVALREIVNLKDFKNDLEWIEEKMKYKVSKDQIKNYFEKMIKLGILKLNDIGEYEQNEAYLNFDETKLNYQYGVKFLEGYFANAITSFQKEDFKERSGQYVTFSCEKENFEKIKMEIHQFVRKMMIRYGTAETKKSKNLDSIFQVSTQLIKLTS